MLYINSLYRDKEPNEEDDTVTEPSFEEEEEVVVGISQPLLVLE